jgi:TPR repeat protein
MTDTIRCPDCGHENPPGSVSCEACNFPLGGLPLTAPVDATAGTMPPAGSTVASATGTTEAGSGAGPPAPASHAAEPVIVIPRPVRRPRARPPASGMSLSLWLFFGSVMVAVLLWTAINGFHSSNTPVEGANERQQSEADSVRGVLAKDSTNVDAQIALGDILYDTGNWKDAIAHYDAGIARDSSRSNALVDAGVSWYNLSNPTEAERYFRLALSRDPHQPVALFNLGVVYESRQDWDAALEFYHRALQSGPPEGMKQPLMDHMQQVLQKSGKRAPPLPDGH